MSRRPEDLVGMFDVRQWDPEETLDPSWNVAPTDRTYAVLERPDKETGEVVRQLRTLRWGLVPGWAKSPDVGVKMINARAESLHEKASFRRPFASRRCLLPADGYYEWVTAAGERQLEEEGKKKRVRKQPYFVTPVDGSVMAMAGLYEFWRDRSLPDDHERAWWITCAVITTAAYTEPFAEPATEPATEDRPRSLAEIHPRMPLVLTPDRWDDWLSPSRTDPEALRDLLVPAPAGQLRAYPVRTDVNNVRNNGPELVEPLPAPEEQTLF